MEARHIFAALWGRRGGHSPGHGFFPGNREPFLFDPGEGQSNSQ